MMRPLGGFGLRLLVGIGLGLAGGLVVAYALERSWVPREYVNIFVLASALLTFGVAHVFLTESGVLAVVVAGLVVGLRRPPQLKHVKRFKLELTELGIAMLFMLLSAKLELARFTGVRLLVLLAIVVFLLRPLAIALATWGRQFELREKVFLSWIAPRGIVAAAMASLFAIRLQEQGHPEAAYLETFTYAVIAATVTLQGLSAPWVARLLGVERSDRRTWVLLGDPTLVVALGRGLRQAGVKVVELGGSSTIEEDLDPADPRFADAAAVLCANTTMLQNVWAARSLGLGIRQDACFRWATFEPEVEGAAGDGEPAGRAVWTSTVTAAAVAEGLASGSHSIDVVEIGEEDEQGRFGKGLQPLFWVKDGRAHIVPDLLDPGPPKGDVAVVLRRRVTGLAELVTHIELIDDPEPSFQMVLDRLAETAGRQHPELPMQDVVKGIVDRRLTMPSAVGAGVAIPHAYSEGVERGLCFLAIVPHGVADMVTPDDQPVRLVFLLVSPLGNAAEHLESLAALASIGQEPEFIELLCRQRVPGRIARLIRERA
jgi:mannitol/fructose-specific phosphotransferase system IIA component (Ntr-type)